ncbi:MAG TPA: tetratricopeptide repeat protein [Alphaproteobacteria bacterium]
MADAARSLARQMTESPVPPSDPKSLLTRAMAARQAGRFAEAAESFRHLVDGGPANPGLLLMYGETLYRLGRLFSARDAIEAALRAAPGSADAEFLLGRVLTGLGQPADAVAALERVLRLRGDNAPAWRFMGPVLWALGREADSEAAFAHADDLQPEPGEFYNQLGIDLLGQRRAREAEAAFRRAVRLAPRLAPAHQNLGVALAGQERLAEAIAAERHATTLAKNSAAAWNNLAVFESSGGEFAAARRAAARALELEPTHADALNTLAQIRVEEGDARAALALRRRVLARLPDHRAAADSLLMDSNYILGEPPSRSLDDAKAAAAGLQLPGPGFDFKRRDRNPSRRLRLGYVSADFRQHSCASFIAPLFAAQDRDAFEIIAYSENPLDDDVTETIRSHTAAWRPIAGLGDAAVAELVYRDDVDVLIDLSGHTAGNRLPVFAAKPAPLQVTWLGYPNTTGLSTIDYRLTDARADPPGSDAFHTERLWRLPGCFLAYAGDPAAPSPGRPDGGAVTFGSFNHLPKVTPEVVAAWSRILDATPNSRLILKAKLLGDPAVRERYTRLFAGHAIPATRLEMVGWQAAPADHLALYRRIDVALDPFPYNGTTTTCEALWMGVPVITLAGDRHAARVGASLLAAAGLEALIAGSEADYVERAVTLGRSPEQLGTLREGLGECVRMSTLCDAPGFARRIEAAFREMWRRWCEAG